MAHGFRLAAFRRVRSPDALTFSTDGTCGGAFLLRLHPDMQICNDLRSFRFVLWVLEQLRIIIEND